MLKKPLIASHTVALAKSSPASQYSVTPLKQAGALMPTSTHAHTSVSAASASRRPAAVRPGYLDEPAAGPDSMYTGRAAAVAFAAPRGRAARLAPPSGSGGGAAGLKYGGGSGSYTTTPALRASAMTDGSLVHCGAGRGRLGGGGGGALGSLNSVAGWMAADRERLDGSECGFGETPQLLIQHSPLSRAPGCGGRQRPHCGRPGAFARPPLQGPAAAPPAHLPVELVLPAADVTP
jgi:hypothetical protein